MGKCNSKNKTKPVNVETLFSSAKSSTNNERDRSEFFYFVEWILSFDFYKKLQNKQKSLIELSLKEDPKKSTIFKIIKAIDSLNEKDKFSVFSLYHNKKLQEKGKGKGNSKDKDKGLVNIEKETLKFLFFHLAKNDVTKLRNILINGPPNNIRWLIWIAIAKAHYEPIQTQLNITNEVIYKSMLNRKILESIEVTILKDITKTNTSQYFNNNFNWQISLTNVLNAIALYDKQFVYCLGMNSISANSLIVSDFNEEESFLLLRYLYSVEYGLKLREFFVNGFPRITYYSFIITQLTEIRLPLIYEVIKKIKLDKTMWIVKWLQTLFGFLKLSLAVRLWDCIIALGFNFLIKFSLGCLKYCEYYIINNDQISNENFNDILISKIDGDKVIQYALSFRIGKETKMKYDQMFFVELIRSEINDEEGSESKSKLYYSFKAKDEILNAKKNERHSKISIMNIDEEKKEEKSQSIIEELKSNKDPIKERKVEEDIILIKNGESDQKKLEDDSNTSKANANAKPGTIKEEKSYLLNNALKSEDNNSPKEKVKKIKQIYNQVFIKGKGKEDLNDNFEQKSKAIKQMKAIYFGEVTPNEEPNEDETKMLCSLTNISYEHFSKQFDKEILQTKQIKKSSNNLVSSRYSNYSKTGSSRNLKFQSSQKHFSRLNHSMKNDSIMEDRKENSSSFVLSDDNDNFYSMSRGKLSDICISNNKGSSSLSLRCLDINPIDENDEEEKTIVLCEEIEPILQENVPAKIVKINELHLK